MNAPATQCGESIGWGVVAEASTGRLLSLAAMASRARNECASWRSADVATRREA
jgi:hypothetical protein